LVLLDHLQKLLLPLAVNCTFPVNLVFTDTHETLHQRPLFESGKIDSLAVDKMPFDKRISFLNVIWEISGVLER
jgi:hypothetical protein